MLKFIKLQNWFLFKIIRRTHEIQAIMRPSQITVRTLTTQDHITTWFLLFNYSFYSKLNIQADIFNVFVFV